MLEKYYNEFKNVLRLIKSLLLCEQNIGQAKVIDNLLYCLEKKNYLEFENEINSSSMWGGAGSVLDIYFEDSKLQKYFHNHLLKLVDLMKKTNILEPTLNLSEKIWF